jgi:TPR repeat protein
MYYSGLGVLKSRQRAKELYQAAADSDNNARLLLEELEMEEKKGGDGTSKS